MPQFSDNVRGAGLMVAAMAGFTVNDALMKLVSAELPLFQAIFLRGLAVSALIFWLAWRAGALATRIGPADRRRLALRAAGEIGATFCFLTALFNMPLANATAILQAIPLAVTLAAAVFLGEPVGWRRWFAIGAGFLGVALIVRPGMEGFTVYSLWALASVGFVTLRDLVTRGFDPRTPSLAVAFATSLAITGSAGIVAAFDEWRPVGGGAALTLLAAALFLFVGYLCGVMTMRVGEVAMIAPFRYTALIWAILLGLAAFGEVPDAPTLIGAGVVAASGVYAFHRERVLARRLQPATPPRL